MPQSMLNMLVLAIAVAVPVSAQPGPAQSRGWQVNKQVDKMSDETTFTAVLRSVEGHASLGVFCDNTGQLRAFVTLPKTIKPEAQLAEIRFDKEKADAYVLDYIKFDLLVTAIGGSKTDANYRVAAKGVEAIAAGTSDDGGAAGHEIVRTLRAAQRMVYRLSLAAPGVGTEGTFNVSGFDRAAAPLIKACIPK